MLRSFQIIKGMETLGSLFMTSHLLFCVPSHFGNGVYSKGDEFTLQEQIFHLSPFIVDPY